MKLYGFSLREVKELENAAFEPGHVRKQVIEEIIGLLKKSQEQGNVEWDVCLPWRGAQQIVDVALAEFLEHLREDTEE